MKKLKTLVLLGLTLLLGLTSCGNSQEAVVITNFELSKNTVSFQADGGSASIQVFSALGIKVLIPDADKVWITAEVNDQKKTVTFHVQPNELAQRRESIITVHSSGNAAAKATLTIVQDEAAPNIEATPNDAIVFAYNETAKDDNKFFEVTTNADWTLALDAALKVDGSITGGPGQEEGAPAQKVFVYPKYENKMAYSIPYTVSFVTAAGQIDRQVIQGPAPVNVIEPEDGETLTFSCAAGAQQVDFLSNVAKGNVSGGVNLDWADVAIEDNQVKVTVEENILTADRTCVVTLTFSSEDLSYEQRTINVIQKKAEPIKEITPMQSEYSFPAEGSTMTFNVNTNTGVEWEVECSGTWFIVSKSTGKGAGAFTITAMKNTDVQNEIAATATVTFKFAEGDETIELGLTQAAALPTLSVTPVEHNNVAAGFTGELTSFITSNVASANITATSDVDWLAANIQDNSIKLKVLSSNTAVGTSRTATVEVDALGASATIKVTQMGNEVPQLSVSPDELTFGPLANAEGQSIKVSGAATWEWAQNPLSEPYFDIEVLTGGYIKVTTLQDNDTASNYEGTLTITVTGAGENNSVSETIKLIQLGAGASYVAATPAAYEAKPQGDHLTTTLTTNVSDGWVLKVVDPKDQEWIKVLNSPDDTETEGVSNATVNLNILPNIGATPRIAKVRLEAGSASSYITITQNGQADPTLVLYPRNPEVASNELPVTATTGEYAIKVTSNTVWTAHVAGCLWLEIDQAQQEGEKSIVLKVIEPNNSTSERSGQVVFTAGAAGTDNAKVVTLNVTQAASEAVTLDIPAEIEIDAAAGEKSFRIKTNALLWAINVDNAANHDWITLGNINDPDRAAAILGEGSQGFIVAVEDWDSFTEARTARLIVMASTGDNNKVVKTIMVRQLPRKPIVANPATLSFSAQGGNAVVSVTMQPQTTEWTWTTPSWLSVADEDATESTGDSSMVFVAEANLSHSERSGVIVLTNLTAPDHARTEIKVTQEAMGELKATVSPNVFNLDAKEQKVTPQILSNVELFVIEDAEMPNMTVLSHSWLTPEVIDDEFTGAFTVEANLTGESRTATVNYIFGYVDLVTLEAVKLVIPVTVNQAAQILVATPAIAKIPAQGSQSAHFTVKSNGTWNATTTANWITLPDGEFVGNKTVNMVVASNNSGLERTADVLISGGGLSQVVKVVQAGHKLELSLPGNQINLTSAAATITIPFNTTSDHINAFFSGEGTQQMKLNWAEVGVENDDIVLMVLENLTTSARSASVTVISYADDNVVVNVEVFEIVQAASIDGKSVVKEWWSDIMPQATVFDPNSLTPTDVFGPGRLVRANLVYPNLTRQTDETPGGTRDITLQVADASFTGYDVEVSDDLLPNPLVDAPLPAWVSVTKGPVAEEGNSATFTITVQPNTSFYPRMVWVKVTLTGITGTITTPSRYYLVAQDPVQVDVDGENVDYSYSSTSGTIDFSSNIPWSEENPITVKPDLDDITGWIIDGNIKASTKKVELEFFENGGGIVSGSGTPEDPYIYNETDTRSAVLTMEVLGGQFLNGDSNEASTEVSIHQEGQNTDGTGKLL